MAPTKKKYTRTNSRFSKTDSNVLAVKAKAGDKKALEELITKNYGIIKFYANNGNTNGLFNGDDLIQECILGVMSAIDRFDPTKNTSFWTYASLWMRTQMKHYRRMEATDSRREPFIQDMSKFSDDISLDERTDILLRECYSEQIIPQEAVLTQKEHRYFANMVAERARLVLKAKHYWIFSRLYLTENGATPPTFLEVANKLNMTRQNVSALLRHIISKLRRECAHEMSKM